ncbi:TPA: ribosomal-protein-alanine N-acetyltransferase [Candidatus Poribacteria bacterium]|nr:ribosomal-protein-alanine N-acetyltransferase [Candidatus Poribacteria bacterium]HIA68213.1 ribosomal-protein-alanine N-acetyltransferase [Candidatus Poribacteria bacterium]HIC02188.1 ribosomal-protein-alanine N-acetyltransferase [Candidatus Poribacteria bacterium]HIN30907.1 ribosomal-protein-alanine N-acetyltransferase [Candidatus Poribacteria bacterium]HIO48804.1 ribosomal-protein-alanine N-acetyltransferase [Candidatus Poribacteria bacterium]
MKIQIPEITIEVTSMIEDDISAVLQIEHQSFISPWSERTFCEGISGKYPHAHFLVGKHQGNPISYINFMVVDGDCHITNLAVSPDFRRLGVAKYMLAKSLDQMKILGGRKVFLEVRASNIAAQKLYREFGFRINNIRKKYYSDNGEDAYILWIRDIQEISLKYARKKSQG